MLCTQEVKCTPTSNAVANATRRYRSEIVMECCLVDRWGEGCSKWPYSTKTKTKGRSMLLLCFVTVFSAQESSALGSKFLAHKQGTLARSCMLNSEDKHVEG